MSKKNKARTDINFLSEEDLDLAELSEQELDAVWDAWFAAAQLTNEDDAGYYSHSCFGSEMPQVKQTSKLSSKSR